MTSRAFRRGLLGRLGIAALALLGCGGEGGALVQNREVIAARDDVASTATAITACVTVGTVLTTTANLNLRTGPGSKYSIVTTMPNGSHPTALVGCPTSGWYNVSWNGYTGWASGSYLTVYVPSGGTRDDAIARAASGVGFSYWWGGGAWAPGGDPGLCTTSDPNGCPNCTHTGQYGADCSGYAAKVWVVPSTNTPTSVNSHPYSTANFAVDSAQWYTIDQGALLKADAMVYNNGTAGHIFIYDSGDGWGTMNAYECKGCVAGCVYDARTATSAYHAIRHY